MTQIMTLSFTFYVLLCGSVSWDEHFTVHTFILFQNVTCFTVLIFVCLWNSKDFSWNNKTEYPDWGEMSSVMDVMDGCVPEKRTCVSASSGMKQSAHLLRMSCALWDGNGPHNQLKLTITAALWVPLQSHPPKDAKLKSEVWTGSCGWKRKWKKEFC